MESQLEVQAFASMMMVSLPYPPLPVACLRSTEKNDAFASGHDLLSSAISAMVVGTGQRAGFDSVAVRDEKQALLIALNDDIAGVWRGRDRADDRAAVDACYEVFCRSYRAYMRCYPGSADLRILPMADVGADSTLVRQAVEHLDARSTTFGAGDDVLVCRVPASAKGSYRALVRLYAMDLFSLSRMPVAG